MSRSPGHSDENTKTAGEVRARKPRASASGAFWSLGLGLGSDDLPALAFIECQSIARGLYVTDVALKKAAVKVISSQPISGGKHVLLFFGDVESVTEAHRAAVSEAQGTLLREILIAGVHADLVPFLDSLWNTQGMRAEVGEAVAIVESQTLAGAIVSADQALKSAEVQLVRMRLGQGIGGKAYFVLTGRQSDVEAAVEAAEKRLKEMDNLVRVDLLPSPSTDALQWF